MPLPHQEINGFIKQEGIDEADDNYVGELLQKTHDCRVSGHSPGEFKMPRTKPENQEMNGTIKKKITDTSDNYNNAIRLLPRRIRCETENAEVSNEENNEIDIIGNYVFEGFVCSMSNSSEFIAHINSDLL